MLVCTGNDNQIYTIENMLLLSSAKCLLKSLKTILLYYTKFAELFAACMLGYALLRSENLDSIEMHRKNNYVIDILQNFFSTLFGSPNHFGQNVLRLGPKKYSEKKKTIRSITQQSRVYLAECHWSKLHPK